MMAWPTGARPHRDDDTMSPIFDFNGTLAGAVTVE